MEEINIKDFFRYLKKHIPLIFLMVLALVLATFVYDKIFKTPVYTTYTTVVLVKNEGRTTTNGEYSSDTINQNDLILNQKLVSTYRQIVRSKLVLQQVIDKLYLPYSTDKLATKINVIALEDTEILKISVTDNDPELAVNIANTTADIFKKEITQIYNINNVSVIDKAAKIASPSNNTLFRDIILAIFVALVGSSGIIFIIYYFDDTLRYSDDMESEIEMPVIAKVIKDNSGVELVVEKKPKSETSESIRTLRTNLQFASVDTNLQTLLVTSSLPSEGKSFISANLAVSFAQAGKRVLLIDCDLRKGRQHKIFKVSSKNGLSNLLIDNIEDYPKYITQTKIENLYIIPRGTFPPNPSELLSSNKNANLLSLLKNKFDIIILDGAPCSGLADSLILSTLVDSVLLVTSINRTSKTELKNTKKALDNIGANLAGGVINNVNIKSSSYGRYYYQYGYGYGYGERKKK